MENNEMLTNTPAPVEAAPEGVPKKVGLKNVPKKFIVIASIAVALVVAVVAAIFIIDACTNTYKAPLDVQTRYINSKNLADPLKAQYVDNLNGLFRKELNDIYAILKKSVLKDYFKDNYEQAVEQCEEEFGDNYKYSYVIQQETKIDSIELKEYKDSIKEDADYIKNWVNTTKNYDSADWKAMADALGITKSEAKQLVKAFEDLYKEMKIIKVTEGYELSVVWTMTGDELETPETEKDTYYVYKINGRWVDNFDISGINELMAMVQARYY